VPVNYPMKPLYKQSIFIVDDDPDDRSFIHEAFIKNKCKGDCVLIEDGSKLMEYLYKSSVSDYPSMILLDLNMPGKDGRQVLKEIKTNEKLVAIPTIIFTTSSQEKDMQISYALGANCFVTKPNSFQKLVDITYCIAQLWLPQSVA
jgi:CheY-like chemotaxis protein